METLLNRVGGSESLKNEKEHVMGRLEWLNHLSLIFNLTASIPLLSPSSISITTEAFLNTLIENFSNLPLKPLSDYSKLSSVKCISFKDIFVMFENDFGRVLNWDHIMEKVMSFELVDKKHRRGGSESPGSIDLNELVFISKLSSSSVDYDYENEHRAQKLGDLRIPHTPPSLESNSFIAVSGNYTPSPRGSQDFGSKTSLRVPELGDGFLSMMAKKTENLKKMNLSCKKIVVLTQELPNTLVQLNLSHNRIERMPEFAGLESLEYLNLNWNFIRALGGCRVLRSLNELYLAHNKLVDLDGIGICENLSILDISFNQIQNANSLAPAAVLTKLKVLDLEGNPVTKVTGWKDKVLSIIPSISEFDSKRISKHTKYPKNSSSKLKKKVQGEIRKTNSGKVKLKNK